MKQLVQLQNRNDLEITCKMSVIENRKHLVDKIKNSDVDTSSGDNLHVLAKHVATEAVEKCVNEHEKRVEDFLDELYDERCRKLQLIEAQ